jgi:lipopolysaccharide/colanic/teichoic acid biosynthesis glycosyltransferase
MAMIGIALAKIAEGVLSKLVVDEFKAWVPWFTKQLIRTAIKLLPEDSRERYEEEWLSHINDVPGEIAKVVLAFQFIFAALKMSASFRSQNTNLEVGSRRGLDILLSANAVIVFLPLMAFIALLIRLTDRCPSLVWDERIGLNGRVIRIPKFRTMRNAFQLAIVEEQIKPKRTWRITRFGSILRKFGLQSLPLLFSVFRGDLALVGPEPLSLQEANEMLRSSPSQYAARMKLRPGLTGLARIVGSVTIQEELDWYREHRTLYQDARMLWITATKALEGNLRSEKD